MELNLIEILKVIFLGIVEGITEWLPISSTGHMLLVDQFLQLNTSDAFKEMFFVVIQLGAILAVVVIFWRKMLPLQLENRHKQIVKKETDSVWVNVTVNKPLLKKETLSIWLKVVIACIPGAIVTILFDDFIDAHLRTPVVIAAALIVYGIAFILVETWNKKRTPRINKLSDITYQTALLIGLFQVLSIIPGTSRSGATIIGALLIGVSRVAAAEFTFFLAVPVMFGLSAIKILKFGLAFTSTELLILVIGMAVAFVVSILVIKFLMNFIKKHDFKAFGWYRIVLGIIVLLYFAIA
ncbi:undecaprenyl-diphosphate phosphatase [Scatolibacter rhodanostii]|uniref:undecaprenyl-diphosphate phosphatase n=1 Tax=Scatolibacter rhodanostii TaxID=2014781 RepID=UPI000C08C727|nr:undecaprenyl-diphosphate phosphatase [Scatolibacter rhodanostii]